MASNAATEGDAGDGALIVREIRVEGLQRISEATVYHSLPLNIGNRFDGRRRAEAIRALYATGFFRDVELRYEGGLLTVAIEERPVIESLDEVKQYLTGQYFSRGKKWLAPLGLLRFSRAVTLRFQRGTFRNFGDALERFQFWIGNAF